MQAVLVMFRSDGEKRSFSISREMTVIGRRQDCDLMIPLGEISRKHCRIIKEADSLRIEDLGSSNGTYHNGRRIQEAVLSAGDTIQVGPVSFVLQVDGVPSDEEITPYAGGAVAAPEGGYEEIPAEGGDFASDDAAPTEGSYEEPEVIEMDHSGGAAQEDELEVLPDDQADGPELEVLEDDAEQPTQGGDDVPPVPPKKR